MEYMIDAFDHHLILINKDKKILIDTGSPISISNQEEIEIFGLTHKSYQTYLGVTIDGISKKMGYDSDALVGGDILKNRIFQVDFNNRLFSVLESFSCEDRGGKEVVDIDGDNNGVDNEFFKDTSIKSNFLCTLGYGIEPKGHPRGARYSFDEVAKII